MPVLRRTIKVKYIFIVIILIVAIGIWQLLREDCPRKYLGYKCWGKRCDHSRTEWENVKKGEQQ